jgi:hypothetical protein
MPWIHDATVAARTARRVADGIAGRMPDEPERDTKGLHTQIVYEIARCLGNAVRGIHISPEHRYWQSDRDKAAESRKRYGVPLWGGRRPPPPCTL